MDTARVLEVASAAARAAGALIRACSGGAAIAGAKADHADLVTQTDRDCQAAILAAVRAAFGEAHAFLGEEDVPAGAAASAAAIAEKLALGGVLWVCDPIDGTTNFVHGLPLSCVSIGVALDGVVQVAVVYDPHRDELFSAVRGGGARCNGAPMRVAQCGAMREALFGWGLHHERRVGKTMLRAADTFMDHCRGLRALGSATLMVRGLGAGRRAAPGGPPLRFARQAPHSRGPGELGYFWDGTLCAP
jgi:myo-inositol-1(or 4)-monophosphatase